jgi:outer membrane protein TolC
LSRIGNPYLPSVVGLLALALLAAPGCTRRFFRTRADQEVDCVLREKDRYPDWKIEQYHPYPDPRARFADPTNPDRPPMPPDDPAAHDLAPNPQKPPHRAGIAQVEGEGYLKILAAWDEQNRAEAAKQDGEKSSGEKPAGEKPEAGETPGAGPVEQLTVPPREVPQGGAEEEQSQGEAQARPEGQRGGTYGAAITTVTSLSSKPKPGERPPYLLKLEQAVELGLINSREYQDARENLYLTALPVTLERFSFAAQFFAAGQALREWAGEQTPGGHRDNWTLNGNTGFAKLFPTGALLLFNFANQTVINLSGQGRSVTSQSTINLDMVQPFLRGGGRAVTLEPLTQSERNLVYGIRDYARFRKSFYVAIAGGGGGSITGANFQPTGVIAAPAFSPTGGVGGSGLTPGLIPSVPVTGTVGLAVNPGVAGRIALQTALTAQVSGYLSTLLQAAQMRVDQYNIDKLEGFLRLAKAMQEGGDISQLQVDQFEQQVLLRRVSLLTDQLQYLQSLDQFKLQLGLPTTLSIELDDSPFRPLNQQFQRYEDLFRDFEAASNALLPYGGPEQVAQVRGELRRIFTTSAIVRGTRFRSRIEASWGAWERLSADELRRRLADFGEERRRLLDKKTDLETRNQELGAADQQRLNTLEFEIALGQFEAVLREYESQPWRNAATPEQQRRQQQAGFRYVVNAFILVLADARNERVIQLRNQWPEFARLCVSGVDLLKADVDEAQALVVQTALNNRLDLMNVRAQVVDAWRQIAVFANALLGVFNVSYSLTSTTPAGLAQPFDFNPSRTQHQLGFSGTLPLVRVEERNNYRAALINYQRARRILQRAEDQVAYDTRNEIRLLRQLEENYRIQQRQVELSYMTVENSLDTFGAPLPVGQASTAASAAALTTQLINAQTSLYNAQFQMTTIWITYLNTRLQLYRDMELMPLDYRGVWTDDVAKCQCPPGEKDDKEKDKEKKDNQPAGGDKGKPAPEQLPAPRPEPGAAAPQ